MPQTHQDPAEVPDKDADRAAQDRHKDSTPSEPSLLGPKGDPAEGKDDIGPKPN